MSANFQNSLNTRNFINVSRNKIILKTLNYFLNYDNCSANKIYIENHQIFKQLTIQNTTDYWLCIIATETISFIPNRHEALSANGENWPGERPESETIPTGLYRIKSWKSGTSENPRTHTYKHKSEKGNTFRQRQTIAAGQTATFPRPLFLDASKSFGLRFLRTYFPGYVRILYLLCVRPSHPGFSRSGPISAAGHTNWARGSMLSLPLRIPD